MIAFLLSIAQAPPSPGQQPIATIRVVAPGEIVHATVPLPDGYAWNEDATPLSVVNADGTIAPTQWERAVWSPRGEVRVAELVARVAPAASYSVVASPQRDRAPQWTEFGRAMLAASPQFEVDGQPLATAYRDKPARDGSVETTREFYGEHVFGWLTQRAGEDFALVDFVLHDGAPSSPPWFFRSVKLSVPEDASVVYGIPEPTSHGALLIGARDDGKLNFIEQRGRREFRLAIAARGHEELARAVLLGQGFGVASTWTTVSAFQPQQLALPELGHVSMQLTPWLRAEWSQISSAVNRGTSFGIGTRPGLAYGEPDAQGTRLGFRHPFGAKYGGITGGAMVDQWRGIELALNGEPQGLLALELEHRMLSDRHAVGLYAANGDPIRPEEFVDKEGRALGGWSLSCVDGRFDANKDGAFGFSRASKPTVASDSVPAEYAELLSYAPIDYQHGIRRWSSSITLVWLANDLLARREVLLNARLWCAGQWSQNRLASELQRDESQPGHGTDWGRAHGWGWHLTAAAYSTADANGRAQLAPYLAKAARVYVASQMANGIWQANANNKEAQKPPFDSKYATEQTIELGITAHAVMAILGSYELAPALREAMQVSVVRAGRDGVWKYLWDDAAGAPWQFAAVRPRSYAGDPFTELPEGLHSGGHDAFQIGSTLAYARMFAPGDVELARATRAYAQGAANPLVWLKSKGLDNLGNRAPLLYAEQHAPKRAPTDR